MEIRDEKGSENVVADHLSWLELMPSQAMVAPPRRWLAMVISYPSSRLFLMNNSSLHMHGEEPWYADIGNYLAKVKHYFWEEPYLFKHCPDQIIRGCVPKSEQQSILKFIHELNCGGHFGGKKTAFKVLQSRFLWLTLFKDACNFVAHCDRYQIYGNISKRSEMPLTSNLVVVLFNVWGIDFMGPSPSSYGYNYILVTIDYVPKWIEAIVTKTNDSKIVMG